MSQTDEFAQDDDDSWICPDLTIYWRLGKIRASGQIILQAIEGDCRWSFSAAESFALQHFTGQFTVKQVQGLCKQQLGESISPNFVVELLQKLIEVEILAFPEDSDSESQDSSIQNPKSSSAIQNPASPRLKACVQWIEHPDGYWILRNPKDITFVQVDERSKAAIDQLGQLSLATIAQQHNLTSEELRYLLQLLAGAAMLEGTTPPKPRQGKFTPMQLLFFKVSLFNPDRWLQKPAELFAWIWTKPFFLSLCFFLAFSTVYGFELHSQILQTGQALWQSQGSTLMLTFGFLAMLVVTLHELGHALTLKHYGGVVPEVGLLFMFFMPAAYTNTTDSYCLVKRRQRVFVVGAGVLCQLLIAAFALWLWRCSAESSWLSPTSYLLLVAALFTIAINLNPLSKFDGYYLAVAVSGINNLRSRAFGFYTNLLRGKMLEPNPRDRWFLAAYAPFSLMYSLLVFGSLLLFVTHWILENVPSIALILFLFWAIYYIFPNPAVRSTTPQKL